MGLAVPMHLQTRVETPTVTKGLHVSIFSCVVFSRDDDVFLQLVVDPVLDLVRVLNPAP